jgi:Tfp pilus assembly protein PilN
VRSGMAPAFPVAWSEAGLPYKSAETKAWFKRLYFGFTCFGFGALALAITVLYRQNAASQTLNDQIALLQPKATALARHQKAQELLQLELNRLALSASPSHLTSQLIENLARALDDNVVVTSLDFDQDVITIEGMSPAPEQLIDVLSKQNGLKDVAFVAPVFRNPSESKSRFSVRLTVPGPKP